MKEGVEVSSAACWVVVDMVVVERRGLGGVRGRNGADEEEEQMVGLDRRVDE